MNGACTWPPVVEADVLENGGEGALRLCARRRGRPILVAIVRPLLRLLLLRLTAAAVAVGRGVAGRAAGTAKVALFYTIPARRMRRGGPLMSAGPAAAHGPRRTVPYVAASRRCGRASWSLRAADSPGTAHHRCWAPADCSRGCRGAAARPSSGRCRPHAGLRRLHVPKTKKREGQRMDEERKREGMRAGTHSGGSACRWGLLAGSAG